jgi:flagella synthesis protein FlgN
MQNPGNSPADSLGKELDAGKALLSLLQQEQQHLVNADLDGLTRVTEEKTRAVAHMTELAQGRHRMLAVQGFEASEAGMRDWLKTPTAAAAGGKSWTALLELAREAKELNRLNGLLLNQHMARNQGAINVLQGAPAGGGIYGPNGQSTSKASSRKLVVG